MRRGTNQRQAGRERGGRGPDRKHKEEEAWRDTWEGMSVIRHDMRNIADHITLHINMINHHCLFRLPQVQETGEQKTEASEALRSLLDQVEHRGTITCHAWTIMGMIPACWSRSFPVVWFGLFVCPCPCPCDVVVIHPPRCSWSCSC